MPTLSKKASLFVLFITAALLGRGLFIFINDPEGPNLLVIGIATILLYSASLLGYVINGSYTRKLAVAIAIQLVLMIASYIFLR